jgi:hypothetical protein
MVEVYRIWEKRTGSIFRVENKLNKQKQAEQQFSVLAVEFFSHYIRNLGAVIELAGISQL